MFRPVRVPVQYAAWHLDRDHHLEVSHNMSMANYRANYRANRPVRDAADRVMRGFGGLGHSRREPFTYVSGHRKTEGAAAIRVCRVAQWRLTFGEQ